jgi:hypothetical protein
MKSSDAHQDSGRFDELMGLEKYLQSMLLPVEPRQEYLTYLHERLANEEGMRISLLDHFSPLTLRNVLITGVGIISSLLILITGVRAILALMSALSFLRHLKQKREAGASPA